MALEVKQLAAFDAPDFLALVIRKTDRPITVSE